MTRQFAFRTEVQSPTKGETLFMTSEVKQKRLELIADPEEKGPEIRIVICREDRSDPVVVVKREMVSQAFMAHFVFHDGALWFRTVTSNDYSGFGLPYVSLMELSRRGSCTIYSSTNKPEHKKFLNEERSGGHPDRTREPEEMSAEKMWRNLEKRFPTSVTYDANTDRYSFRDLPLADRESKK